MDTPTRERIEALEARVQELENKVIELERLRVVEHHFAKDAQQGFREIKDSIKPIKHESTTAGEEWKV